MLPELALARLLGKDKVGAGNLAVAIDKVVEGVGDGLRSGGADGRSSNFLLGRREDGTEAALLGRRSGRCGGEHGRGSGGLGRDVKIDGEGESFGADAEDRDRRSVSVLKALKTDNLQVELVADDDLAVEDSDARIDALTAIVEGEGDRSTLAREWHALDGGLADCGK